MARAKEFFKFLLTGGLAASVNFGSRFIYSLFLDFSVAVIVAYVTGMVVAFWLFSTRVFQAPKTSKYQAMFRFTVVNLFGILQTWLVSVWLLGMLGQSELNEAIAHLAGMSLATVSSYFGHRLYTFRV